MRSWIFYVLCAGALSLGAGCGSNAPSAADAGQSDGAPTDAAAQDDAAAPDDACVPLTEPTPADCDVVAQTGCECGARCILYAPAGGPVSDPLVPACAPVRGDAQLGEPCVRPADACGDDTCASSYCANVGRPADATSARICHAYCDRDHGCGADAFCLNPMGAGVTTAGYCTAKCYPFTTECPTGEGCRLFPTVTGAHDLTCSNQVGTGPVGTPCTNPNTCLPELACAGLSGNMICTPYCDDDHPCATGTCTQMPDATFRTCLVPM